MSKKELIKRTIKTLEQLPEDKIYEVADFTDFVLKKYEEQILQEGIEILVSNSKAFEFLNKEEDLYSEKDLKLKF